MEKKILVTGGTGYIGSHTTVELIEKGFSVVIVDILRSSADVVDRIEEITGTRPARGFDVCDGKSLMHSLKSIAASQDNPLCCIKLSENRSTSRSVLPE
jgi:UDP-glucose 4-epimerase